MRTSRFAIPVLAAALLIGGAVAQEDEVVARVDGVEITRGQVMAAIEALPPEYGRYTPETLWQPMLDQLIERELVVAAARAQGLDRSEVYLRQLSRFAAQMLHRMYMSPIHEAAVTEAALAEAYGDYVDDYESRAAGEEVRARHILVESEAEALALVERLGRGEDFAALAREASIGPSAGRGGDLGWFGRGDMVTSFSDAAFALEPGEVSAPVESPYGWHVILTEEMRSRPTPGFDEVADDLRAGLAQEAGFAEVERLRRASRIEILAPAAGNE